MYFGIVCTVVKLCIYRNMMKPTRFSKRGGTIKFQLACDEKRREDKDWLVVKDYLGSRKYNVLIGKIKQYKDAIIKFDTVADMEHEYHIANQIFNMNVPNFIKFLCVFTCNDTIENIRERNFFIDAVVCNGSPEKQLGMIVMPYYSFGNLNEYRWNRSNFDVFKNVLKQIVSALLFAFETCHFVHGDMHAGNVLLRHSKKTELKYGTIHLPIMGIYPMIMDFGKSYMDPNAVAEVYRNIERILYISGGLDNSDLALSIDLRPLETLRRNHEPISQKVYDILYKIIDTIEIRYVHSEMPPNPFAR